MQIVYLAAILAAISSSFAIPLQSETSKVTYVDYLDNFDDLTSPFNIFGIQNLGPYRGLNYAGFSVSNETSHPLTIRPPSMPNYLFVGQENTNQSQLLPANSSVAKFDLQSLSFACALQPLGRPAGCTILLVGRKAPGYSQNGVVYELFYNPPPTGGTYNSVTLPRGLFINLVEVGIAVIATGGPADDVYPYFDNVAYRAYFK